MNTFRAMHEHISDYIIPMIIGWLDRKRTRTYEQRVKQATTYKNTLIADYDRSEQGAVRRNLKPVKMQLTELELQHESFNNLIDSERAATKQRPGLSPQTRLFLLEDLDVAHIYTKGDKHFDMDDVIERKKLLCVEGNTRKIKLLDKFNTLRARYNCKMVNYLRSLNKDIGCKEICMQLDIPETDTDMYDFTAPLSSHMNSKNMEMEVIYRGA